jgi:hypothetical protein
MHPLLKVAKQDIRDYLIHYSDEKLAALLAHAQDGKLAFYSCCCLIGSATADHALRPRTIFWRNTAKLEPHYARAQELEGSEEAEWAYGKGLLAGARVWSEPARDALRRRRLIPILKAELHRRQRFRQSLQRASRRASLRPHRDA